MNPFCALGLLFLLFPKTSEIKKDYRDFFYFYFLNNFLKKLFINLLFIYLFWLSQVLVEA